MSLAENKALARRALALWSRDSKESADQILSPDYVNHQHHHRDSAEAIRGLDAWKRFIAEFHEAFPDFQDSIEQQIAEGDMVATRFTSTGTQKREIMGVAATGKQTTWTGIAIDRVANGKIVESWVNWDMLGMLQQLGRHS
jgi:steroid delta-isomerase-like uncharacterized protein